MFKKNLWPHLHINFFIYPIVQLKINNGVWDITTDKELNLTQENWPQTVLIFWPNYSMRENCFINCFIVYRWKVEGDRVGQSTQAPFYRWRCDRKNKLQGQRYSVWTCSTSLQVSQIYAVCWCCIYRMVLSEWTVIYDV